MAILSRGVSQLAGFILPTQRAYRIPVSINSPYQATKRRALRPKSDASTLKARLPPQIRCLHPKSTATAPSMRVLCQAFRIKCQILRRMRQAPLLNYARMSHSGFKLALRATADVIGTICAARRHDDVAFSLISGIHSKNPGLHDPRRLKSIAGGSQGRRRANSVAPTASHQRRHINSVAHGLRASTQTRARARHRTRN